jgi:hypothetical protein
VRVLTHAAGEIAATRWSSVSHDGGVRTPAHEAFV